MRIYAYVYIGVHGVRVTLSDSSSIFDDLYMVLPLSIPIEAILCSLAQTTFDWLHQEIVVYIANKDGLEFVQ